MKHKLFIHCFDQWWHASVEDDAYLIVAHNVIVLMPASVKLQSRIIYDETVNALIENKTNTTVEAIKMEIWMLNNIPELNIERRAFDRKRRSYARLKKLDEKTIDAFNNAVNR